MELGIFLSKGLEYNYVKETLRKLWKKHDMWHFTMYDSVEFINIIFKNQDPLGEVSSTFLNA